MIELATRSIGRGEGAKCGFLGILPEALQMLGKQFFLLIDISVNGNGINCLDSMVKR